MTQKETLKILASIRAVYPSVSKDRDIEALTAVWQRIFAETPYELVSEAVTAYIATDTKGFPPTPGNVNAYIARAKQLEEPDENEAWALVMKALRRGGYNSREEFEKLPEEIRRIVGSPVMLYEWSQMSVGEVNAYVAGAFRRSYRARQELKREMAMYPALAGRAGIHAETERKNTLYGAGRNQPENQDTREEW